MKVYEAYHTWLLIPREHGTYIVMEEIGLGSAAKQLAQANPGHMHRGHDLWNISLKFLCETRPHDAPRNSSARSPHHRQSRGCSDANLV